MQGINPKSPILGFLLLSSSTSYVLESSYVFHEGCKDGIQHCTQGRVCGNSNACVGDCTLEQCEATAKANNSFAFAFRGTSRTYCRLCNEKQFYRKGDDSHEWGIYTRDFVKGK